MLVTYLPRMLPLVILSRVNIPPIVLRWLGFIPVAVLSSLLAPEILLSGERINISLNNTFFLASIPSFLVAIKTRNLFYTVFAGMCTIIVLNHVL